MKYITLLLFVSFTFTSVSQNNPREIAGMYYLPSGNPEGGTTFVITPDNDFVVFYFGGMKKGEWSLKHDTYTFVYHTEPPVVLYGRYHPSIKDSISLQVGLDANRGFALKIDDATDVFTPVFNEEANCFNYPYIHTQQEALQTLSVLIPNYNQNTVYEYNLTTRYNEFILTGLPSEYSKPGTFTAQFDGETLVMEDGKSLQKKGDYSELNDEDASYISSYLEKEVLPDVLAYGSEFFPYYENPTENDLLPFTKLDPTLMPIATYTLAAKSLFTSTCDD